MSDNSIPLWVPLLAGGGVIGFVNFFVKQVTDQKDANIVLLNEKLSSQDKQHQQQMELVRKQDDLKISNQKLLDKGYFATYIWLRYFVPICMHSAVSQFYHCTKRVL